MRLTACFISLVSCLACVFFWPSFAGCRQASAQFFTICLGRPQPTVAHFDASDAWPVQCVGQWRASLSPRQWQMSLVCPTF